MGIQKLQCGFYCPSAPSALHLQSTPMGSALLTTPCLQIWHLKLRDADSCPGSHSLEVRDGQFTPVWLLDVYTLFLILGASLTLEDWEFLSAVPPLLLGWHPSITTLLILQHLTWDKKGGGELLFRTPPCPPPVSRNAMRTREAHRTGMASPKFQGTSAACGGPRGFQRDQNPILYSVPAQVAFPQLLYARSLYLSPSCFLSIVFYERFSLYRRMVTMATPSLGLQQGFDGGNVPVCVTYQERCASFVSRAVAILASLSAWKEQLEQDGSPQKAAGWEDIYVYRWQGTAYFNSCSHNMRPFIVFLTKTLPLTAKVRVTWNERWILFWDMNSMFWRTHLSVPLETTQGEISCALFVCVDVCMEGQLLWLEDAIWETHWRTNAPSFILMLELNETQGLTCARQMLSYWVSYTNA